MMGNVNVLSISDGPCRLAAIFSSSPSGEILTVSDAAGEEDGREESLVFDWGDTNRYFGRGTTIGDEDGGVELGRRTRIIRY